MRSCTSEHACDRFVLYGCLHHTTHARALTSFVQEELLQGEGAEDAKLHRIKELETSVVERTALIQVLSCLLRSFNLSVHLVI
jgi:hypothetical protein